MSVSFKRHNTQGKGPIHPKTQNITEKQETQGIASLHRSTQVHAFAKNIATIFNDTFATTDGHRFTQIGFIGGYRKYCFLNSATDAQNDRLEGNKRNPSSRFCKKYSDYF